VRDENQQPSSNYINVSVVYTPSVSRLYGFDGRMSDELEGIGKEVVVI
jgi:hypothetical protein